MQPRIETLSPKTLIGKRLKMSFANYRVTELWKSFIPQLDRITDRVNSDLISMSIYPPGYYQNFDPKVEFEKWAAAEATNADQVPARMEVFNLPGGLYAVFDYKGSNTDNAIYHYIFGSWLPASAYQLDDRPHFEVLGTKYRNNDPASEEEIWVPVRPKI